MKDKIFEGMVIPPLHRVKTCRKFTEDEKAMIKSFETIMTNHGPNMLLHLENTYSCRIPLNSNYNEELPHGLDDLYVLTLTGETGDILRITNVPVEVQE